MNNRNIQFIQSKNLGRYLYSLDSVRFLESNLDASKAQAKLEVFSSLMLGRTIPVGEHQFIDSYGLLDCAYELLTTLEELPRTERSQIEHIFPFQLFFRKDYKTIDGLVAAKLGDPNYKLSLWTSLNEAGPILRKQIKKRIEDGTFKWEEDDLVLPGDKEAARMLHKIRDRFSRGERSQVFTLYGENTVDTAPYIGLLEAGITTICKWSRRHLVSQSRYQSKLVKQGLVTGEVEVLPQDLVDPACELIESLKKLKELGLKIDNRSDIRIGALSQKGRETNKKFKEIVDNDSIYEGILEIFDSLYNTSISKSCQAHSESSSSARSVTHHPHVRAALALSVMAKDEITDQASLEGKYFNPPWKQDYQFNFNEPSKASLLFESMPWKHVWESYFDEKWRASVSNLNLVLAKWDHLMNNPTSSVKEYMDIALELEDAESEHIANISRILAHSGWKFFKEQKTNRNIVGFVPWAAGVTSGAIAKLVISQVGIDPFWEETIPESIAALAGVGTGKLVEPTGQWITKGYIRKTFARLIEAK